MKRNVKIGIAAAVLFVVGMAYKSHVNARFGRGLLVGSAIANRDSDRDDNGNAGAALGTAAILGTAGAIGRAARDDDRHDNNNGRSRRGRRNR